MRYLLNGSIVHKNPPVPSCPLKDTSKCKKINSKRAGSEICDWCFKYNIKSKSKN